mgnify:CR=1 FL=1
MEKAIINPKEAQKGITLIALVITIIVLLILAGVSIAMLTGQNGILTQANNAKNETELASAKEKVELAVIGAISQTRDGTLTVGKLRTELANYGGTVEGDTFPVTATVDGKSFTVDANGNVELAGSKPQMTEAKIVASANGEGTDVPDDQAEGTELYISFKASLENGTITSVTCDKGTVENKNGLYVMKITQNGTYTFTITGTGETGSVTSTIPVKVSKYDQRAGIKVGDYVSYTPDTATGKTYDSEKLKKGGYTGTSQQALSKEDLNWRVLRKNDDGSIDLIGDATSNSVYFSGSLGYNNGVYLLNDICKELYSNSTHHITARSVNLEDMEKWLTDSGKTARAGYTNSSSGKKYGETKEYAGSNSYTPDIYGKTEDESANYYSEPTTNTYTPASGTATADNTLNAKQTYYNISINSTNYGDGAKVLSSSNYYWVAARYVNCNSSNANFGLRNANSNMNGNNMFNSNSNTNNNNNRLRPVDSINCGYVIINYIRDNVETNSCPVVKKF